jgi:glycosyltransferase involved in cell wall biosynthesis
MKVSICIPTWEQHGYGKIFLERLLESIDLQTYKNFNVVISDHSLNSEIFDTCMNFKDKFEIIYVKNELKRGNGPANTNNSIKNAKGELIKIMFQDDFFYANESLENIVEQFGDNECKWLVCGSNHTYDGGSTFSRPIIPRWNDNIIFGVNTISSPSVLSVRNENLCFFDEDLEMMMDCEMYYQLYLKFGLPKILNKILITNTIHKFQISSMYQKDINKEITYIKKKYNL